jgi:hypothetical protein
MRWRYALSFDHQIWLANDCLFAIYDSMGPLRLQRLMKCFLSICPAMLRNEEECITISALMKIMLICSSSVGSCFPTIPVLCFF